MANKPDKQKSGSKVQKTTAREQMKQIAKLAFNTEDTDLAERLLNQSFGVTRAGLDAEAQLDAVGAVVALVQGFKPKDNFERMLSAQIVGTHEAAMECLRRANLSEQTFEGRDMNLKHAEKLLVIYTRQIDAFDKHRGKGRQKITVEHVNVHPGGQAVIGDVHTADKEQTPPSKQQSVLADDSAAQKLSQLPPSHATLKEAVPTKAGNRKTKP